MSRRREMSSRDALSSLIIVCIVIVARAEPDCDKNISNISSNSDQPTPETCNTSSSSTNDTTSSLASTLEPIYFGRHPGQLQQHQHQHHHHHHQPLEHPQADNFYQQQYDPPGDSFYYLKDEPSRAKPEFESASLGGSRGSNGGGGGGDNDIVTLQAFSPPQNPASSGQHHHHDDDETMRLLRMLAPDKQVQLVNNVGRQVEPTNNQPERPSLSLVSGQLHSPAHDYHRTRPMAQSLPAVNATGVTLGSFAGINQLAEVLRKLQPAEEQEAGEEEAPISIQQPVQEQQPPQASGPTEEERQFLASLVKLQQAKAAEKAAAESREADEATRKASLPIDRLVDHLMANSRLSSFGVQHEGLTLPEDEEVLGDEDEEDEEEDGEEEEEPHQEQDNQEEAQESVATEVVHLEPAESAPSFSSVLNKSTSWVPLSASQKELARKKSSEKRKKAKRKLRNKKKNKKKKNKRAKRSKKKFGLMIGGRMLSRNDLIRLISILNKMASSKSSSSEEREASRKLLRFLIRLMLEEFKKSKANDEKDKKTSGKDKEEEEEEEKSKRKKEKEEPEIRDLLRPILEGPADAANKSTDGSIELRPLVEPSTEADKGKEDESSGAPDDGGLTSNGAPEAKNDTAPTGVEDKKDDGGKRRGLSELSRDLETYFDTDFYEDMADKVADLQNNNTARPRSASGSTAILAVAANGRGKPKLLYTMPVPIYGQQLFEAADEDEDDFEQVAVVGRPPRKRSSRSRRRRGRLGKSSRAKKRRRNGANEEADDGDGDEEADGEQSEEEEEQQKPKPRSRRRGEPVADQARAPTNSQEGEEQLDQEPEEPAQSPDSDDHEDSKAKKVKNKTKTKKKKKKNRKKNDKDKGNKLNKEEEVKSDEKGKAKRRRRRYRRRKDRDGKLHIDYDHRYDVPAPIEAGKWATSTSKRANGTSKAVKAPINRKRLSSTPNGKSGNKRKVTATANSTAVASGNRPTIRKSRASSKRYNIEPKKQLSGNSSEQESGEDDPDEPPTEEEPAQGNSGDEDYYNEGTSYSKVCDDDNKCKVSVQSSSPKLKKAIKSRDKTKIEQHLGPWLEKEA